MIKLSNIILENYEKEKEKLLELLHSGDYYLTEQPIYRGMSSFIETFTSRGVRVREKARNTQKGTHELLSAITDTLFSDHPNRKRANFGSFSYAVANSYGKFVNIIVPRSSAKVRFYSSDTWPKYTSVISDYMISATNSFDEYVYGGDRSKLRDIFINLSENYSDENIIKVVRGIYACYELRNYSVLEEVLEKYESYDSLKSDLGDFYRYLDSNRYNPDIISEGVSPTFRNGVKTIFAGLEKIEGYFGDGSESPKEFGSGQEAIIEGKHLIISRTWFEEHFEWNGGDIIRKDK